MPDKRGHRGPHPEDACSFAPAAWLALKAAVVDLSWLLSHGYADCSSLKLVGDRYTLTQRQRTAVMRCACSDEALARRRMHELAANDMAGRPILLDGYNVLTTVEVALSRGVILEARDGCYRDIASMHGTFRTVRETAPAVTLIGEALAAIGVVDAPWYLDSPVSNSGRLKTLIRGIAESHNWPWRIELVPDPDAVLAETTKAVATSDSVILDHCGRWFNLARFVVRTQRPETVVVPLADATGLHPA